MKKALSRLALFALVFTGLFSSFNPTYSQSPFPDSGPYEESINFLHAKGIVLGNDDGTVTPYELLNRAAAVTLALRANYPDGMDYSGQPCFTDVFGAEWYAPATCGGKKLGVVDGNDDGSFAPARSLNYVEWFKMLIDGYGIQPPSVSGPWYAPYEAFIKQNNLAPVNYSNPADFITRGEVFDLMYRFELNKDGIQPFGSSQPPTPGHPEHPTNEMPTEPLPPEVGLGEGEDDGAPNKSNLNLSTIFEAGSPVAAANATTCNNPCAWSDASNWMDGAVPGAGANVHIPANVDMILDASTPDLGGVAVEGRLILDRKDLNLTADFIFVSGLFQAGSPESPFINRAVIELNGRNTNHNVMSGMMGGMGNRGLMVAMGGQLELHADVPEVLWTSLNANAASGSASIVLEESVNWKPGDQIIITPTDFFEESLTELRTISSVSGNTIGLTQPLTYAHWGALQYPSMSDGVSLTPDPAFNPPRADGRSVIDERADVGLLTRNIVIQGANDTLWNQGYGAHIMVMGNDSNAHVKGVELARMGQAGENGRYPFHMHHGSYSGTSLLSDVSTYLRDSSINTSKNRAIVIHGTNGSQIDNNVVYNVLGHALFMEDAVERRNKITNNLIAHVRDPEAANLLKNHESRSTTPFGGSVAYWLTNPDNEVVGNVAADVGGAGFWLAFPAAPVGDFAGVDLKPQRMKLDKFDYNTAYSTFFQAFMLDNPQSAENGSVHPLSYLASPNVNAGWGPDNYHESHFNYLTGFKTGSHWTAGCFWHRGTNLKFNYPACTSATGIYMNGSGAEGEINFGLFAKTTLNNSSVGTDHVDEVTAVDTYHSTFEVSENTFINFEGTGITAAFSTTSSYIRPVDKFLALNGDNLVINSHFIVRPLAQFSWFTLASVITDPFGLVGPAGNALVYDVPFLTHNATCQAFSPAGNGVSCNRDYYGILDFQLPAAGGNRNDPTNDLMEIRVERYADNDINTSVGVWQVGAAADTSWLLAHMRDFAAAAGGIYELTFPSYNSGPKNDITFLIENLEGDSEGFVLGIEYSGPASMNICLYSWPGAGEPCTWQNWVQGEGSQYANSVQFFSPVGSIQDVISSTSPVYYHDAADQRVWVNFIGVDLSPADADPDPLHEPMLYNKKWFRIHPAN